MRQSFRPLQALFRTLRLRTGLEQQVPSLAILLRFGFRVMLVLRKQEQTTNASDRFNGDPYQTSQGLM